MPGIGWRPPNRALALEARDVRSLGIGAAAEWRSGTSLRWGRRATGESGRPSPAPNRVYRSSSLHEGAHLRRATPVHDLVAWH